MNSRSLAFCCRLRRIWQDTVRKLHVRSSLGMTARTWGKNPASHRAMGTAIRYATSRSIFSTMYSPDAVAWSPRRDRQAMRSTITVQDR